MSGAHRRDLCLCGRAEGIHTIRPVFKIAVDHLQGERRPERLAEPHPREHGDAVGLDLHAVATSVAALPAREGIVYVRTRNDEPRGQSLKDRRERGAVRFPCRDKTQSAHLSPFPCQ